MINKKLNYLSKIINSIEYFDSITVFNFAKKKLTESRNIENNKNLRVYFDDFRFHKPNMSSYPKKTNFFLDLKKKKISKRSYLYRFYENILIKNYLKEIKK